MVTAGVNTVGNSLVALGGNEVTFTECRPELTN